MKNKLFSILIFGFLLGGLQSCQKEDDEPLKSQVINIDLKMNESFVFTLPESDDDESFNIQQQATHFAKSSINKSSSSSQEYSYTPSLDYSGTDNVVLTNEIESSSNQSGHHRCGNDEDEVVTITINFNIKAATDSGN